jgi:hypothetical protein
MIRKGGFMFGHDKHDDDDDVVQPSTQPANEALLGVNDDDNDTSDVSAKDEDPTDLTVVSGADVPSEDDSDDTSASSDLPTPSSNKTPATDDLLDIKRQALQELSPLVGHLDQTPEEKFKTTMMMIQATDDQSLVPNAYEAAKSIEDDKARAQALLDIINEINYFTQEKKD